MENILANTKTYICTLTGNSVPNFLPVINMPTLERIIVLTTVSFISQKAFYEEMFLELVHIKAEFYQLKEDINNLFTGSLDILKSEYHSILKDIDNATVNLNGGKKEMVYLIKDALMDKKIHFLYVENNEYQILNENYSLKFEKSLKISEELKIMGWLLNGCTKFDDIDDKLMAFLMKIDEQDVWEKIVERNDIFTKLLSYSKKIVDPQIKKPLSFKKQFNIFLNYFLEANFVQKITDKEYVINRQEKIKGLDSFIRGDWVKLLCFYKIHQGLKDTNNIDILYDVHLFKRQSTTSIQRKFDILIRKNNIFIGINIPLEYQFTYNPDNKFISKAINNTSTIVDIGKFSTHGVILYPFIMTDADKKEVSVANLTSFSLKDTRKPEISNTPFSALLKVEKKESQEQGFFEEIIAYINNAGLQFGR